MAIDSVHASYAAYKEDWQRMRDVLAGQRAVRARAADYLRRPAGLKDNQEWERYVNAVDFFEATLRTLEGLTGLAFYRDPEIKMPDTMADFVRDVTQDGVPLRQFIEASFEDVLGVGRVGVMLDMPKPDPSIRSQRDAELAKRRPFLKCYSTENIFNWRTDTVNGVETLVEVRLWEVESERVGDWGTRWRRRIRVLLLEPTTDRNTGKVTWSYRQRVFVHNRWDGDEIDNDVSSTDAQALPGTGVEPAEAWTEQAQVTPLVDGRPLDYMPFWIINPTDQTHVVKRPPMLGLANLNLGHFRTTSNLENALFWCGNPQPYVTGVNKEDISELEVGSSSAWTFPNAETKVDFLSYGTDALEPLEKRLDRIEQQMAVMGARMLSADQRGVEAAETARIHRQGEISVLAGVCGSVSRAFTDIVVAACAWQGAEDAEAAVKILTAFYDQVITTTDALNLMKLWQAGVIDIDDLIAALKKGQLVGAEKTPQSIAASNQSSPIQPIVPNLTPNSTGKPGSAGTGGA